MNRKKIEQLIYNYTFMLREVIRLESMYYGTDSSPSNRGVAQYGLEAAMPKGTAIRSAAEMDAMDRRELRMYNRIIEYRSKIILIEGAAELLENDVHRVIFDCMTDGMSYRSIGQHLGMSRNRLNESRNEMIEFLLNTNHFNQKSQKGQKGH